MSARARLAAELRADGGLLAAAVRDVDGAGPTDEYALLLEAIREGYEQHYGEGRVLRTIHGPAGRYVMLTGVRQHGYTLWLGSLTEKAVGRIPLS